MRSRYQNPKGVSIRWKLAVYLAGFIALVLIVTWVFQVYLLDTFYEHIKKKELAETADYLAEHLESDEISLLAYSCAVDGTMTVSICRLEEGKISPLISVDATGRQGMVLSDEMLLTLCDLADQNGGKYLGRFFGAQEVNKNEPSLFFGDGGMKEQLRGNNVRLMYLSLVETEEQNSYLILLNAGLQPLESTVQILRTQFFWIAAILLICAGIMVFLLYRHISAPLVSMNEAAKQLALGKYDAEFSGKGYRETRELAETLNYASNELSRLDRLQKELIANISHDLRTPLTMIKGYSEIMRDLPGENTPENMQVVIDETTRLSELVNDLLDLSKIQSGSRRAESEPVNLTAALEETMNRYDTFVRHKGYRITLKTDATAWVYADRGMILQVLYNLINNAINYTGADLTVTVTQEVIDRRVRISVADTGEGIAPEQMPMVWDRYYKVDKIHRRAMIGTGLGLSIVKEILEQHRAAYGVSSTVGEGSTFWFELPILSQPDQPTLTDGEE